MIESQALPSYSSPPTSDEPHHKVQQCCEQKEVSRAFPNPDGDTSPFVDHYPIREHRERHRTEIHDSIGIEVVLLLRHRCEDRDRPVVHGIEENVRKTADF